jgi:hypothetical protein
MTQFFDVPCPWAALLFQHLSTNSYRGASQWLNNVNKLNIKSRFCGMFFISA